MLDAYKSFFKNYININGCASRSEFWYVYIPNTIISLLLQIAVKSLEAIQPLYALFLIATFIPSVTLGVRRFHDLNKSGWLYVLYFIPFIGQIIILIWFCKKSVNGNQNYKNKIEERDSFDF